MSSTTSGRTGWAGWGVFAGVILLISGVFGGLQGLVAIVGPDAYFAVVDGSLFLFDVQGWGWWNLIVGVLLILTGIALLAGQTWARVVAIILAALSAIGQLMLIPTQPFWALAIIAVDILVIYALTAHGRELTIED
ncbi:hypothetical protein JNB62_14335 [Microbacterium jejuense]|uniref:DUF7144 domain-containing protein n=1 Tax=Microbacterium jejuense TaxID=1263637 RepID=A0ABS7HPH7_9MICO|nr:hypothetical protein [Microbacterium jejuense]MBW9094867.1 hypothetical protein [Microbacterium jejuense]